jgi:hypothetical protein
LHNLFNPRSDSEKKVDLYFDGTDLLILVGVCLILITSLYLVDLAQMIGYTSQFSLQHILVEEIEISVRI